MPREVTVACENPRAARAEDRKKAVYMRAVEGALRRSGVAKSAVDWSYIETLRKTGVDPRTAAAMSIKKPHEHTVVGIAAEAARRKKKEALPPREAVLKAIREEQKASASGAAYLPKVAARIDPPLDPQMFKETIVVLRDEGLIFTHAAIMMPPPDEAQWMPGAKIGQPQAHAFIAADRFLSAGAEEDRSAMGDDDCDCKPPALGPICASKGRQGPQPAPAAGDSGFSKVVKDETKFKALLARAQQVGPIDNDAGMYRFIRADLEKQDQEIFYVVGLDSHNGLRMVSEVARGQRDRVAVDVADVLRVVLIEGCAAFVVAHNHPAGDPRPSEADKKLTAALDKAAHAFDAPDGKPSIVFLDHLVIGSSSYYSFADKKLKRA